MRILITTALFFYTFSAIAGNKPYSGEDKGKPIDGYLPQKVDRHLAGDVSGKNVRRLANGCYIFIHQGDWYSIVDGDVAAVCDDDQKTE